MTKPESIKVSPPSYHPMLPKNTSPFAVSMAERNETISPNLLDIISSGFQTLPPSDKVKAQDILQQLKPSLLIAKLSVLLELLIHEHHFNQRAKIHPNPISICLYSVCCGSLAILAGQTSGDQPSNDRFLQINKLHLINICRESLHFSQLNHSLHFAVKGFRQRLSALPSAFQHIRPYTPANPRAALPAPQEASAITPPDNPDKLGHTHKRTRTK
ncbi:MAG: hypothetical protein VXW87_01130 [Pseudomonadota bacterium]|nr:hypothetical protein [Pseudomonadota bacterium]